MSLANALAGYAAEASRLAASPTTTEATYYPAIRALLGHLLDSRALPFDARTNTSEVREGGGSDLPDLALYDGSGDFVVVCGEVKLPGVDLKDLSVSTERNDQIGRYLAGTQAVLISNVRAFGLLTVDPSWEGNGPVPPERRRLEQVVELWPSATALQRGDMPLGPEGVELADLVETAVTRYAPIAEPESLARILARQARRAKSALPANFSQAVRGLLEDFGEALGITFEGEEGEEFFRSSLIQTVFYALFSGWVLWRFSGSKKPFRWQELGEYLKIPFLAQLFFDFQHPARIQELRLSQSLDIATETLHRVATDRFFSRFVMPSLRGGTGEQDDGTSTAAIVYFYEPFLEAFDPELRKELGVWFTPPEVVRYQVRNIDRILREVLDCPRGLADDRVVVLDPCCGTGAYLVEVLRVIAEKLREEGQESLLGASLLEAATRRLIGFEILTAPFVVAQLQIYLILSRLGAPPVNSERPAVFLTNALTGWEHPAQLTLDHFPELQAEHDAAQSVKTERRIIVILGNPPYNRFAGVPVEEEAELVDHYKGIERDADGRQIGTSALYGRWGIRKQLLDDLYIRFFRLAEKQIGDHAPHGVVSFISNYSYLGGRSHPIMRESLLHSFHTGWIDCLNGDKYKTGKVIPEGLPQAGSADQSVFSTEYDARGIQVGTCISTWVKTSSEGREEPARVFFRDFWGKSLRKRRALLESLELERWSAERIAEARVLPEGPREYEALNPTRANRWRLVPHETSGGYEDWPSLEELFPKSYQGVNPNRGVQGSVIDTDNERLASRMRDYFSDLPFDELATRHPELCKPRARYEPEELRETLRRNSAFMPDRIVEYLLFPFDLRWVYYETEGKLLNERRPELWENLAENEFLIAVPQPRQASEALPLAASSLFDLHLHDRGSVGIPAEIMPPPDLLSGPEPEAQANLSAVVADSLAGQWHGSSELLESERRELCRQLMRACLAVGHSPQYFSDHRDALAQDWARIPIPKTAADFGDLVELGDRVGSLLDPCRDATSVLEEVLGDTRSQLGKVRATSTDSVGANDLVITYSYWGGAKGKWVRRDPLPEEEFYSEWGEHTGDLFINEEVCFRHVPERVWSFELGGYPVLKKWLAYRDQKRRSGKALSLAEVRHFREVIGRIAALLLLHSRLDSAYERASSDAFTLADLNLETGAS